jgi:hypothetical protein
MADLFRFGGRESRSFDIWELSLSGIAGSDYVWSVEIGTLDFGNVLLLQIMMALKLFSDNDVSQLLAH